jgi:tRNA dimethylallyltransferase
MKPRIVFLVGPTASGKTARAVSLAKKLNAEIISCDSMQVYRGMGIISSQPSARERAKVRHHLVGVIEPSKDFNVSQYRRMAMRAAREILGRKKTPLFVGGTGLYMSVVVDGIFRAKTEDPALRLKLRKEAARAGSGALHARLAKIDPPSAAKIHPNDAKRVIRALEVYAATGKPMSEMQRARKGLWETYDIELYCIELPREELYRRIERRVDRMFAEGLVGEVRKLLKRKLGRSARYAIGIEEVKGYLDGAYGLDEAKEMMKRATRRYAKRQLTWFRKDKRIVWIKPDARGTTPHTAWKKHS